MLLNMVYHINGNPLDNKIENLRYILFDLNSQSKPKKLNCSSQYIGVNFNKRENKWKSNIRKNGKLIALGTFENEIDAAKIYDIYTIDHYKNEEPRTNGLLTEAEINDIKQNGIPEKYQRNLERNLPKNIVKTKTN